MNNYGRKNNNKLVFNYGAMDSGKTREILRVIYSKKDDGFYPITIKPKRDTKGDDYITSRDGSSIRVDLLIDDKDNIYYEMSKYLIDNPVDLIIVDEAQFLNKEQIDQLGDIVDELGIDVYCYGLLTDFKGNMFEGSKRLIEISDDKIEIERECKCGRKKLYNSRMLDGFIVLDGEQIGIDGDKNQNYSYVPYCRQCYKRLIKERKVLETKGN